MRGTSAVAFVMPGRGHMQRVLRVVDALAGRGVKVTVFGARECEADVLSGGQAFVDLFAGRPPNAADAESFPVPCRWVSFAAHFAEEIVRETAALGPDLVVSDTFAVIGLVVASVLGLPHVNVCAGHDVHPAAYIAQLEADGRVDVSAACHEAVNILRDRYGLTDASPFSYLTSVSSDLNVYCEPPAYLSNETRRRLEPIEFFGSLPALHDIPPPTSGSRGGGPPKVYASLGTIAWWYYEREALAVLMAIADAIGANADARAVISLGNAAIDPATARSIERPNVSVHSFVDQWQALDWADVFVTHHGLNSTHEAIFTQVPMVSYPMLADQPDLADLCERWGMAVPLVGNVRGDASALDVDAALTACRDNREGMGSALRKAKALELDVLASRPEVVDRILRLV